MEAILYRWITRYLTSLGFMLWGSGGGGSGTSTQVVQNYSPSESARRDQAFQHGEDAYQATKAKLDASGYPGAVPAQLDPNTIAGQQTALGQLPGLQQTGANVNQSLNFSLNDVLYPGSNPALQQYIQQGVVQPGVQALTDVGGALTNIRTGAGQAGQFGGSRQGLAEGIAASRTIQDITAKSAGLSAQAYGQGLDAMGRAQALYPQTQQAQLFPAATQESIGRSNEAFQQEMNNFAAAAREFELTKDWQALAPYANMVFGAGGSQSTTTATSTAPKANRTAGTLGGAASGAAMGAMYGSAVPGIGTAFGAVIGGLMGAAGGYAGS